MSKSTVVAEVAPSPGRRFVAVAMLAVLGTMVVYLTFSAPPESLLWRVLLVVVGVAALFLADMLRRSTLHKIELTDDVLRDTSGRELCRIDDIAAVERGAFAFKPSHGFLIRTKTTQPRAWAPGLWWRFGRKIGVGGVTPSGQAKFMAELIALRVVENKND
ncbi:MAG: hypothetical protein KUG69_14485 [Marinosulfonomonas sp.]|nr:hypothetical protein [Marinosulfonomonas sp.]